ARANAVRGSGARITVRCEGLGHSGGTMRHPAPELSAAAAAFRLPTNATSVSPAESSGAAPINSISPSPSNVAPSHSANSRTRMPYHTNSMPADPSAIIAPTARIHPDAVIGPGVRIGEFCIIESDVVIGESCSFEPYVYVKRWTT